MATEIVKNTHIQKIFRRQNQQVTVMNYIWKLKKGMGDGTLHRGTLHPYDEPTAARVTYMRHALHNSFWKIDNYRRLSDSIGKCW